MIYIGKIDKITRDNFLKPAYKNYKNMNYDLSITKIKMIEYLIENDSNIHKYSTYHNDFKLNIFNEKEFKLNLKNCDDITYIFCTKTGNVSLRY